MGGVGWGGRFDEDQDIYIALKYLPIKYLLMTKENLAVGELETTWDG